MTRETEEWRSRYGKVRHHNGMRSPAVLEPDGTKKYPYLINKEQIDNIFKEHHGDDAPIVWSQVYGFPVPKGSDNAVISEREIVAFKAQGERLHVKSQELSRLVKRKNGVIASQRKKITEMADTVDNLQKQLEELEAIDETLQEKRKAL